MTLLLLLLSAWAAGATGGAPGAIFSLRAPGPAAPVYTTSRPLTWPPELAAVAAELAPMVARGGEAGSSLIGLAKESLRRRGRNPARLLVRTARLWSPDQMPELEPDLDWARSAGLAVALPRTSSQPVSVVLVLTGPQGS